MEGKYKIKLNEKILKIIKLIGIDQNMYSDIFDVIKYVDGNTKTMGLTKKRTLKVIEKELINQGQPSAKQLYVQMKAKNL